MMLFQFAILWQPNKKEVEDGQKPKIIQDVTTILAADLNQANMMASMKIPSEYAGTLEQIVLIVRPF